MVIIPASRWLLILLPVIRGPLRRRQGLCARWGNSHQLGHLGKEHSPRGFPSKSRSSGRLFGRHSLRALIQIKTLVTEEMVILKFRIKSGNRSPMPFLFAFLETLLIDAPQTNQLLGHSSSRFGDSLFLLSNEVPVQAVFSFLP